MFPNWHDDMHVPTVGDDVRIAHLVTIDSTTVRPESFRVAVQPQTADGLLSDHAHALRTLLQNTHRSTARFLDRHLRTPIAPADLDQFRVDLKNILENYRSTLEYTAHYLADRCAPKPRPDRVHFPVANEDDTATTFAGKLDTWFPGLSAHSPKAINYLLSIQQFSGESWLRQLADLSNFNKHRSLSAQELDQFPSVVVKFGTSGVRFGELGLRSLSIEPGGVLRFLNASGQYLDLDVPCLLNATTKSLHGADPRMEVVHESNALYRIPSCKESIVGSLWRIDKNVFRAVDRICSLLS